MLVNLVLEGTSPLLMNRIVEAQLLSLLQPKQRKVKLLAEDKTPREIAEEKVYRGPGGNITVPTSYFVASFKNAASDFKQTDRGRKTMKHIGQVIFRPTVPMTPLLDDEGNQANDFEIDLRAGTNVKAQSLVAVCRPRFEKWRVAFTVKIDTDLCSEKMAHEILSAAGIKFGVGSYRNGGFGQFRILHWDRLSEV